MKICWDNLEHVCLSKRGNLVLKTKNSQKTMVYYEECKKCNDPYLTFKDSPSEFYSRSCDKKYNFKGENNPSWKGGISKDINYVKQQGKKYYLKNRKHILLKNKKWRKNNKERRQKYRRKHYKENIEKYQKYGCEYHYQNIERRHEYYKKWCESNRDKRNAAAMKRKAIKLQAMPFWADKDDIELYYVWADIFNMLFKPYLIFEVDHEVPLQGKNVCGLHVGNNLQLLQANLNRSKNNKWPLTKKKQELYEGFKI